jgi:hypothetical protein
MAIKLIRGALNLSKWALCAVGTVALLLTALVATPLARPPEMRSVSESRKGVDFSNLPAVERFQARDGTMLGFRHYPASSPATGRAAIVIHGSSGSSGTYFMLFYTIAGLWVGYAFVAIGVGITVLTLIGYFYIGEAFPLWMALVNGGGLILGGLWMRRS